MEHAETLKVLVGDLVPGSFVDGDQVYFPRLDWTVFTDTFKLLRDRPDAPVKQWPLYPVWTDMCDRRFGYMPKGDETPDGGRGFAWEVIAPIWRRQAASFFEHGYQPDRITPGEKYRVCITSNGKLAVTQGNKRVALLRMLGGLNVPLEVSIVNRHEEWLRIKRGIFVVANQKQDMYHPLDHPDFVDWTVTQPCQERLDMIQRALGEFAGSVLDLGCHTGWFCRALTQLSCEVTGVERNKVLLDAAKAVGTFRHDGRRQPTYVNSDIGDYLGASDETFDVCLYLSIFMHIFPQSGADYAWKQLNDISRRCHTLFLDIAFGGYQQYMPFTPATFAKEVIAHTQFTRYELLGRTQHENRPFYVFRR